MKHLKRFLKYASVTFAGALVATSAVAADVDFGKVGEPVKLVIGYQPYYTESWSGVVMRSKKVLRKVPAEGVHRRVPDRPAGRDHRQQPARGQASHRLHGRHVGHLLLGGRYAWPACAHVADRDACPRAGC